MLPASARGVPSHPVLSYHLPSCHLPSPPGAGRWDAHPGEMGAGSREPINNPAGAAAGVPGSTTPAPWHLTAVGCVPEGRSLLSTFPVGIRCSQDNPWTSLGLCQYTLTRCCFTETRLPTRTLKGGRAHAVTSCPVKRAPEPLFTPGFLSLQKSKLFFPEK